jgi:starch synthase
MSSFVPIYLKTYYESDTYLKMLKLFFLYTMRKMLLDKKIDEKLKFDNISGLKALDNPTIKNFVIESMNYVDMVVKGDEFLDEDLDKAFNETATQKSEYLDVDSINQLY